ncbi:MAG TPA: rhomboid family intramembrane serine protease [Galbitalea sp.]|nr:rhomboid family intramembrane serine protease [Galbitalea sp.]
MDTTGESTLSIILDLVVLVAGLQVAARLRPVNRRFPIVAVVSTLVIGIPSLLQFAVPSIGAALSRQPSLELQGQWWRILTAVMAQDGGLVGAIFNLVVVAVVVTLGERAWGRWRTVVLFLGPSVVLNLLAIAWNAPGGGSSFASDALLLSMCALGVLTLRRPLILICAGIAAAAGIVLVGANDAHGVAMLLGAVLGLGFGYGRRLSPAREVETSGGARAQS